MNRNHLAIELIGQYVEGRFDRRQFFRRMAAIGISGTAGVALLNACRGGADGPATDAASSTLKIRADVDIANLDSAFIASQVDSDVSGCINEGLVTYKPGTFDVVNQLAETFTPSSDGLTFEFILKQGIQFHGNYGEVTADDVKFSFERIANPSLKSPYAGDWAALREVKIKDKYSGTIILKEPFVALMRTTVPVTSGLVHSEKAVKERGEKYATNPIGTGPYEFANWTPKQKVTLKRFDKYGGASNDYIGSNWREIHFIPILDDSAADIALQAGDVDFGRLSLPGVDRFQSDTNFTVTKSTTLNYEWIGMNILHPKLKDIRVRHAIRYAIDVPSMIDAAFNGKTTRATSIIPPNMGLGYWSDAPVYDRDVEKAKSLLKEAAGSNLELSFTYTDQPGSNEIAQIAQQNLSDIGIRLTLNKIDPATAFTLGKHAREGELFYAGYVSLADPSWSMVWFTCAQFDAWNPMYWCDKKFDDLQTQGLKELDASKRNEIYVEMQKLMDQAAIAVWIGWPTLYFGSRKGILPKITPTAATIPYAFEAI